MTARATMLRRYREQPERFLRDHADNEMLRCALQSGSGVAAAVEHALAEDDHAAAELQRLLGGTWRHRGQS